jgi:hypothetical protein
MCPTRESVTYFRSSAGSTQILFTIISPPFIISSQYPLIRGPAHQHQQPNNLPSALLPSRSSTKHPSTLCPSLLILNPYSGLRLISMMLSATQTANPTPKADRYLNPPFAQPPNHQSQPSSANMHLCKNFQVVNGGPP